MISTVAFYTLGCKLNFAETSTIAESFSKDGYCVVDFKEKADIYVINTCTVTENAERECRQIVRRALRINPGAFIAVTGCYAQLNPNEIAGIEGVDAILGSHEKFSILDIFDDFRKRELSCIYVSPTEKLNEFDSSFSSEALGRTRAFLKIQDGCDYKCTFCTIPLARGKSRSLDIDSVKRQFTGLLQSSYKEIILTGVNVGDYGNSSGKNFFMLLNELIRIPGDFRIRISSIEPNLLSDDIIKLVSDNDKICNHFHIPLQSGSPKILKLMQRRYNSNFYRELIYKVIDNIKDPGIGIDVIVGFPGETEDDFLTTYSFLNELPVSYLHVFTYSERPNTKAINMPGSVGITDRKRRNNMLRILSEKKRNAFYEKMEWKSSRVLFEHDEINGYMMGWTSNYIRVRKKYDDKLVNTFSTEIIADTDGKICNLVEEKNQFANASGL